MKIFKPIIFGALAFSVVLSSCIDEITSGKDEGNGPAPAVPEIVSKTFSASLESGSKDGKASLQDQENFGKVYWESGDEITMFALTDGGLVSAQRFYTEQEGPVADFTNDDGIYQDSHYYAVYPHTSDNNYQYVYRSDNYAHKLSSEGELSMIQMSSSPAVKDGASGFSALAAGKVSEDGRTLLMKNVGGLISFDITDPDITSVTLYSNSGEDISGVVTAVIDKNGIPVVTSVEGSNMVRIVPANGSVFESGTYYFCVAPTVFESGLTLLFTNSQAQYAILSSQDVFTVERSKVSRLPAAQLLFGGKVVEFAFIRDNGSFTRPFGNDSSLPSSPDAQKGLAGTVHEFTYKYSGEEYPFSIYGSTLIGTNSGTKLGLLFGSKVGDFIELPDVNGYALDKVVMRNSAINRPSGNPAIVTSDGALARGGDNWRGQNKLQGTEHIWNINGDGTQTYRLMLTDPSECNLQALRLFYHQTVPSEKVSVIVIKEDGGFGWPFETPAKGDMTTSYQEPVMGGNPVEFTLAPKYGGQTFTVYASSGFSINSGKQNGFRIHGTESGDYILFPALDGKYLTKVEVVSGESGIMRYPSITNEDGNEPVLGGGAMGLSFGGPGDRYTWRLSETKAGERYKMVFNQSGVACIQRLILTFSDSPLAATDDVSFSYPAEDDIIPDFSRVGYMWGDKEIPSYDVIATLKAPSDGSDATKLIQDAIDAASGPGAILLKAGTYNVSGNILLNRSNVVLRGEGAKTIIKATGTSQRNLIEMGLKTSQQLINVSSSEINTPRLAVGQLRVPVKEPWKFSVGDRVVIWRPATYKWLDDLKMTQIPQNKEGRVVQWDPADYNLTWERTVTAIEGDFVCLDNPVVMETSYEYGGGWLIRCNWDRISGSGVENMHLDTEFNESEKDSNGRWCDENHAWSAVIIRAAEHCWVRNVTSSHFAFATVHHATGSKNITVENCHGYMPVSEITGSRRYAFQFSGAQLCIVKDCSCEHDRHAFATSHARTTGPNVYLRCTATDMFGDIGPHVGWSSGVLYDNVKTDSQYIAVQDRHNTSEGHGWAGVNFVLYNCVAPKIICQNPWVTGKNYAIGCVGEKVPHNRYNVDASFSRPDGEWTSHGAHVTPQSLYEDSLEKRHAAGIYIAR